MQRVITAGARARERRFIVRAVAVVPVRNDWIAPAIHFLSTGIEVKPA